MSPIKAKSTKRQTWQIWKKIGVVLFLINSFVFIYIRYVSFDVFLKKNSRITFNDNFYEAGMISEYIIYNSKCKIPKFRPWEHETRRLFVKESYVNCSNVPLLTHIKKNKTHAVLSIRQDVKSSYSSGNITCCFSYVDRGNSTEPDKDISVSTCIYFEDEVILNKNIVNVNCYVEKLKIYSNVHAFTIPYPHILKGKRKYDRNKRPPSVLFVGIDSISNVNMLRVLKRTHDFLEKNNWIGYHVYNKIGLNTFPNIMAILAGMEIKEVEKTCNPYIGLLNKCHMIWDDFEKFGYVTANGEDGSRLSTYHHTKKGFRKQPTDFYFRAYNLAMDRLARSEWDTYCSGPETSGERILNLALDFVSTFKNHPSFALFWMTSFSHWSWTMPQRLDERLVKFFKQIERAEILKNTIVIFLSDHGIRYGASRSSSSGWLEERIPFLYFWLPRWFRRKYPNETLNVITNSKRLTTPYDLHMTLQHLMVLSGLNHTIKQSAGCPRCKSLFQEIEKVRSCNEASISDEWCACTHYQLYNRNSSLSWAAAAFVLQSVYKQLYLYWNERKKCSKFTIVKILQSSVAEAHETTTRKIRIAFETLPRALFEAIIFLEFYDNKPVFHDLHALNRLDPYEATSGCTTNEYLKMLCYCKPETKS